MQNRKKKQQKRRNGETEVLIPSTEVLGTVMRTSGRSSVLVPDIVSGFPEARNRIDTIRKVSPTSRMDYADLITHDQGLEN
jgi:hypothetical protein